MEAVDTVAQSQPDWPRRGLYAITPDCDEDARLFDRVAAVLAGGAALLQYRGKRDAPARRRSRAQELRALCRAYGALFIVNDDVGLAHACGADGVHLGADDGDLHAARAELGPDAIVGASCYADLDRARRARDAGASYLAFGAFFPSPTKPHAVRAQPTLLREAAALGLPRVAIGGIRLDNALPLLATGVELLAVISDVFDSPDPRRRSAEFAALCAAHAPPPSPLRPDVP